MFDIGFLELLVLSVVGLLVLGPERLPRVARTLGAYVGKARRTWTHVRMEIEREIAADEIKRAVQEPVEELKSGLGSPAADLDELRRSTERAFSEPASTAAGASDTPSAVAADSTDSAEAADTTPLSEADEESAPRSGAVGS